VKSICFNSGTCAHINATCSKRRKVPPQIRHQYACRSISKSGSCWEIFLNRPCTRISWHNSSFISRTSDSSRPSPGSTLPPGNSHRSPNFFQGGRCATSSRPCEVIRAAVTLMELEVSFPKDPGPPCDASKTCRSDEPPRLNLSLSDIRIHQPNGLRQFNP